MTATQLTAESIQVSRDDRDILRGVDLEARAGQLVAVSGPSGAGKSTLLAVLGGLVSPGGGSVLCSEEPATDPAARPVGIAFILQTYGLVTSLTAGENVAIGLRAAGVEGRAATQRSLEALARLGVSDLADRLAEELSGGQRQRVAVVRALVLTADLVLADEPTSELDEVNRDHVMAALRQEAERGAIVLVASHDPEVAELCDREYHLLDGAVEWTR
jgi:putative ABC transport system ATP-binding protein